MQYSLYVDWWDSFSVEGFAQAVIEALAPVKESFSKGEIDENEMVAMIISSDHNRQEPF